MKKKLLHALSKAINTYLALDPESEKRLHRLKGKAITVELLPFHFIFQLVLTEAGVDILDSEEHQAETRITGTPLQLLNMTLNKHQRKQFFSSDVRIEGNAELGQDIIHLFDHMEIDWEEYLSKLIGDVPAYHATRILRGVGQYVTSAASSLTTQLNEYIHEEAAWLPSKEALQDLYTDIDQLHMDADRLEAHIKQLKARAEEGSSS